MTRLPRGLHPGAWWLWALGLATAVSRTTNPLLLGLVAVVTAYVVAARRPDAPWGRSYGAFLRLGLVVFGIRLALQLVLGGPIPGHLVLRLPELPLPAWAAGVRLGGPVTVESLATGLYDGLRLAVLLACVGAANALASPTRLLKALPGALYEAGVAVTVALSFAPQAVLAVGRVREARVLRGRRERGLRALRGLALPVLEGALERSVALAAAMDARGFGRRAAVPPGRRRVVAALTLGGLLAVCAGLYGALDATSPRALGLPMLTGGAGLAAAGLTLGGRGVLRTRYRPDPWRSAEWVVAGCGLAAAAAALLAGGAALSPSTVPLQPPVLPLVPALAVGLALVPAWAAPEPPP